MFDLSSPTVYIPTIFLALVTVFVTILQRDAKRSTHENTKDLPYYSEIGLSMQYISRNILENGRFKYRNHINPEIRYDNKKYNSLRHAGVLYSMFVYEKYGLEKQFHEARVLASKYFLERYIKKVGKGKYAVVSLPEEEGININIAKSGAVGIALSALSNLYSEGEISLEILQGLGEFLLYLQSEEGNIYAYMI